MLRVHGKHVEDPTRFGVMTGINRDPRWNLVCAIVQFAANDYMRKPGRLHTDADTFFRSEWFETLCPSLDQDVILEKLEALWHEKWDGYLGTERPRRERAVRPVRQHVPGAIRQIHRVQKNRTKLY